MKGAVLAVWLLPMWATVDALTRPSAAFRAMRHRKVVWLVPGPFAVVGFLVDPWYLPLGGALLLTVAYMAKVRDLVKVAQGVQRG